jgi:hypothetical protein
MSRGQWSGWTLSLGLIASGVAQSQTLQCPPSVRLQVKSVAPFAVDGSAGVIRGFGQVFSPRRVRLVGVEIGVVREGESFPLFPLQPDDLASPMGRRAVYTLWNGSPPAPDGELHLVCEYEGGLVLNKSVGRLIRRCELTTQLQGKAQDKARQPPARPANTATAKKAAEADADAQAATAFPVDAAATRAIATRAVLACR